MKLKYMMSYALFAPDTGSEGAPAPSEPAAAEPEVAPAAPAAPAEPAPVTFSQEQVNAMLATERGKATRKANKSAKSTAASTETPSGAPQAPVPDDRLDKLTSVVEGLAATMAEQKEEGAFASAILGLPMDETEAAIAPTLFKHDKAQFDALVARVKARDEPPAQKGAGFNSPGAPSSSPTTGVEGNPTNWTSDDVENLRKDGKLLPALRAHKAGLGGGRGGLFPAKNIGGSGK